MNKHQIKGATREAAGKVAKNVGKATANGTLHLKGAANELIGKAEKSYGDAQSDMRKKQRDKDIERHAH